MKDFINKYIRYIIVGVLFVVLVVVIIVFVHRGSSGSAEDGESVYVVDTSLDVPKDSYEVDKYPNVNTLLEAYFNAIALGDADTVASLSDVLSDEERIRIQVQAKYYDGFFNYVVYTKAGPAPNSYFAFVTYDIQFTGMTTPAPALSSVYVCTNESGALYVNKSEPTEDEKAYFQYELDNVN